MSKINATSGSAVMTGEKRADNYLTAQKIISNAYLAKFFQILTENRKKGRYLEIGAGPGYQTAEIMEKFRPDEIVIVEPSGDMIATADRYLTRRGFRDNIDMHAGYVEDEQLILSLGKFDLIYSTLSLHHWGNAVQAFQNLARVLEPGGLMVIHDFRRIDLPFNLKFHGDSHRAFTPDELDNVLDQAGITRYKLIPNFPFQILVVREDDISPVPGLFPEIETLDDVNPGHEAAVMSINTDRESNLELKRAGILLASRVKVLKNDSQHVICGVEQKKIVIDRKTASGITVQVF